MDGSTKYVKAELFRRAVNVLRELKNSAILLHAGVAVYANHSVTGVLQKECMLHTLFLLLLKW